MARFKLIDRQSGSFVEPARKVRIAGHSARTKDTKPPHEMPGFSP